ncbi:hypothetical protein [Streptomyces sp. NPDC048611]|uniref:hypothetical protein n=1 Tax=Streptomyces sp. NPDC048611 TaxID=3155635 RepID=UPI00341C84E4
MTATAQPLTTDELIAHLACDLPALAAGDGRITPFTVTNHLARVGLPTVGYTRAYNALHDLHASGLLHETRRSAVYALRPDLPTSGDGHVWLRLSNRAGAPVEVIGKQPRPADGRDASEEYVRWTCHGCGHGQVSGWFVNASKYAQEHGGKCRGEALAN